MTIKDSNTRILTKAEYPVLLRNSQFAPPRLFIKGTLPVESAATIAMVGTRRPSTFAEELCRMLVTNLRGTNAVIVSGLAQGIDSFCHKAALDAGIPTVAVLAQGLNCRISGSRRQIAEEILAAGGALVSEVPGDTPSYKSAFPARNRIIEGLSQTTVVVESKAEGGALITADFCLKEGRPLWCIPGDLTRETASGTNALLRAGKAKPIWAPEDFADLCGAVRHTDYTLTALHFTGARLSPEAHLLFTRNAGFSHTLDELQKTVPFSLPMLLAILTELEIAGLAHSKEGHSFHFCSTENIV